MIYLNGAHIIHRSAYFILKLWLKQIHSLLLVPQKIITYREASHTYVSQLNL